MHDSKGTGPGQSSLEDKSQTLDIEHRRLHFVENF